MDSHQTAPATTQSTSRVVMVSVPSSVANNFDKMTKVTQSVLNKLGCGTCHSGRILQFIQEDSFWVDEHLNVSQLKSMQ
jgi:hypothetical protein